ncbi:hypothetical protein ACH79_14300 [Bradyrhizobium sp. CCBAU 051011]|uniref:hypothetical protein n=1 Tax=Bradyrhizobium sp. CCBAU 051011 TaxID=858422 RepID=UPI001373D57C|nr:hypothetical protein [Bradyrhizobium sp. CCBAU 051011]QHO73644.1 hypothetical protein ACH79_14300 [Bradyrhizobium sp. CCBAU 051011]
MAKTTNLGVRSSNLFGRATQDPEIIHKISFGRAACCGEGDLRVDRPLKAEAPMNIPLDEWSGSKATNELRESFERGQRSNTRLTRAMLILAAIAAVAGAIAAVPVIQAWIK